MSLLLEDVWAYWHSGGLVLIPIALVCFGIWAYFFKTQSALRGALGFAPPDSANLQQFDVFREAQLNLLQRDFVILAALTAAAPLLGLLGTVLGMIGTFDAVSGEQSEAATRVAGGISQALITTQFGLLVAIPGVFGIARLRRLLEHVQVHLGTIRSSLLVGVEGAR